MDFKKYLNSEKKNQKNEKNKPRRVVNHPPRPERPESREHFHVFHHNYHYSSTGGNFFRNLCRLTAIFIFWNVALYLAGMAESFRSFNSALPSLFKLGLFVLAVIGSVKIWCIFDK